MVLKKRKTVKVKKEKKTGAKKRAVAVKKKKTVARPPAKKIERAKKLPLKKIKAKKGWLEEKIELKTLASLKRYEENPIITPRPEYSWESKFVFNPAAFEADGKVYLLYRAVGDSDVSVLGYAASGDGYNISERLPYPAYAIRQNPPKGMFDPKVFYCSGGGWNGGCEDPRLTLIGNRVYMLYTAFDGWGSIRIALTSISLDDFKNKRWNWKKPVFISRPGEVHKNWVLFPEKINGKYAILHCIAPKVLVDYVKDLDKFTGKNCVYSIPGNRRPPKDCEGFWLRGAGPTPIKTKYGWLLLCQMMDVKDPNRYKIGAMLLDLKDPTKVLYRSAKPLLEPDEWYENEGFKAGVIYSCGAAVLNDELLIYYGGADTVSCVASANLEEFLKELIANGEPKVKRKETKKGGK